MSSGLSLLFAAAAVVGFFAPPTPVQGGGIIMALCNGGTIEIDFDDQRTPPDDPRGCHVACTLARKSRDVAAQPDD